MNEENKKFSPLYLIFDILAIFIFLIAFFPIAKVYYQANPPAGLDFYQFPTYVRYLTEHLRIPPMSWKYIWFDGVPTINDYSGLFFYLTIPFAKIWGWVMGSKIFLLLTTYLYFLFAYLFLKEIARSRWFALAATLALMWTTNIYDALFYGGNATYAATQFFSPLVFWLMAKYYHTNKKKLLFLSIFFAGLSYWGHAGTALIFVWVPASIFLLFWVDEKVALISAEKIKNILFYVLISMGIGFLPLYAIVYLVLTIPQTANFSFFQEGVIKFPWALKGLFLSQNLFLLISTIILIALTFVRIRRSDLRRFTPFIFLMIYMLLFEWLYIVGRNPFGGGILPPRTYWFFALVLAGLAAVAWSLVFDNRSTRITLRLTQVLVLIIIFLAPLGTLVELNQRIFKIDFQKMGMVTNWRNYATAQSTLGERVLGNSILLQNWNIDDVLSQKKATKADKDRLKGYLIPTWMDYDELNYRFHTLEVGVNIWWSILFDLPLTHGAYNSAHFESNNYTYWTDMAFHGELTTHWNHPLPIAKNDLLFLIDWRAIRYLLGNEVAVKEGSQYSLGESIGGSSSLVTFLTQDANLVDRQGLEDLPTPQKGGLTYFRLKEDIASPIIKTTSAPTILVIGEPLTAYDNIIRNLAHLNLNSRYLIPVKGPASLGAVSLDDLKNFDVVLLQYYQADANAWKKLEKYVQEGGNLVIETGGEVKESDTKKQSPNEELPAVFPIKQTARGALGKDWNLSYSQDEPLLKDVNSKEFGPLKYENDVWNISYAEPSSIRSWAQAVLKQNNKPFLVAGNFGQGKVIWSGLNLSYHFNQYFSQAEGQLFKNILSSMIDLKDEGTLDFKMERPQPEKVIIEGSNFRGAVLKENNYGGWSAELLSPYKKKLKVYNAGLGYSYIQLPKDVTGPAKIEFRYRGTLFNWFFFILAVIISLWLLVKSIVPDRRLAILGKIDLKEKIMNWWHKDD